MGKKIKAWIKNTLSAVLYSWGVLHFLQYLIFHQLLASFILPPLPCTTVSAELDIWAVLRCCVCCILPVYLKKLHEGIRFYENLYAVVQQVFVNVKLYCTVYPLDTTSELIFWFLLIFNIHIFKVVRNAI